MGIVETRMNAVVDPEPRPRRFALPGRGAGEMAVLDFGPPDRPVDLVFSHANGFNARAYRSLLAPLARDLRILAPDLRGHGASTLAAETEGWSGWQGFAADIIALLEVATDGPLALAGHSLGATASLLAAGARPQRVRALLLVEPVLFDTAKAGAMADQSLVQGALRRRDVFQSRAQALAAYRGRGAFAGWSEAQLADYVAAAFRDTDDGRVRLACRPEWEARTYAIHTYDLGRDLGAVRCPTRIFAGERESTVSAGARARAAGLGMGVEVVAGTDHFLPMQRPDLVRAALRAAAGAG